jgi:hypothetical protein
MASAQVVSSGRSSASKSDDVIICIFWSLVATSLLVCVDSIIKPEQINPNNTHAVIVGAGIVGSNSIRILAIGSLLIAALQIFTLQGAAWVPYCRACLYKEFNAICAILVALAMMLVKTLHTRMEHNHKLSDDAEFICEIGPWACGMVVIIYQVRGVLMSTTAARGRSMMGQQSSVDLGANP